MRSLARLLGPILLFAALTLAACDSAEERETHYQRALAVFAAGDPDRAAIELRNVFRLNGNHTPPARLRYARLLKEQGDITGALGQYQRLVEQDRHSVEGHKELGQLAITVQDFGLAGEAADRAYALAPDNPEVRALKATLDYRYGAREGAVS